jgi:thiamine biosynthesis protein ThiS
MTINIVLNGDERSVPPELSLKDLLEELALPTQRIAVELNKQVVRRSEWPSTVISDGDRLEVVHFVGGG